MLFGDYSAVGQRRDGVLKVDGNTVATEKMEHTLSLIDVW
jgi:arylsulfatase